VAKSKRPDEELSEKSIMHRIMIAVSAMGARLFRNQVGMAFQSNNVERFTYTQTVEVRKGDVLLRGARTVMTGFTTGSSDLLGWTARRIDEYDVGRTVAVFTACEVKSADGKLEPEQKQFLEVVRDSGGIAIVAKSVEEAQQGIRRGGGI
jgi:hypothetical protein